MKSLTKNEFEALIKGAELLKEDSFGPKVYRRADATYVKLFRQKRIFSLSNIWPYVKRFRQNSLRLKKLGIDTVNVNELYYCPDIKRTIVTYSELEGELLRSVLTHEKIQPLAKFIAELHQKGIYFRSIHLENIIFQANGTLGLIDIADMRIRCLPLSALRRVRNLCHLLKYKQDIELLSTNGTLDLFLNYYLDYAKLSFIKKHLFIFFIHKYIQPKFIPAT